MAETYGWAGKILRVNLTTGEITTPRPASPPSASPAVHVWQAAPPELCPLWTGIPSPAQHRLHTWTCKEELQWLKLMAGQVRSCAST